MKFTAFIPLCVLMCANVIAADPATPPAKPAAPTLATPPASGSNLVDKGSYAVGATVGNQLRMQGSQPNIEQVIRGLRDGIDGKIKLSEMELRQDIAAWRREAMSLQMAKNKKVGDEFIAKKAAEPGVKKLSSGVLYKVINSGKGPKPTPTNQVSAHYKGTLIDGTEFDSSYSRGQPLQTPVNRVIPGWQDALTNMHVGDKWELYVPSEAAYGERGSGPKIGPGAALIFEMELLAVLPPDDGKSPIVAPPLRITPNPNAPSRPATGQQPQIRVTPSQPTTPAPSK
jgi:FKBP-type peptidyl-prolyl cis-trans isomerase FklB